MINELLLAVFIMAVGLSAAGAGTHLYQHLAQGPAQITFSGRTYIASLGSLVVSFICGPYIMLKMGWEADGGKPNTASILLAALVSFGWAFITGLVLMGIYMAVL